MAAPLLSIGYCSVPTHKSIEFEATHLFLFACLEDAALFLLDWLAEAECPSKLVELRSQLCSYIRTYLSVGRPDALLFLPRAFLTAASLQRCFYDEHMIKCTHCSALYLCWLWLVEPWLQLCSYP